jgi:hypothetical protein
VVTGGIAVPETFAWGPGFTTATVLDTDQLNEVDPVKPLESVTVTVTELEPAVVGVPEIVPVEALMPSPAGSPVAAKWVMVAVDELSEATTPTVDTGEPETLAWLPGLVTATVLSTVQLKVVVPV